MGQGIGRRVRRGGAEARFRSTRRCRFSAIIRA